MGLAIPYDDYVSKAKPWYEVLRKVAFSPFGLFVLNASYAILGDFNSLITELLQLIASPWQVPTCSYGSRGQTRRSSMISRK